MAKEQAKNAGMERLAREWLGKYQRPSKYRTGWFSASDAINTIGTSELSEMLTAFHAHMLAHVGPAPKCLGTWIDMHYQVPLYVAGGNEERHDTATCRKSTCVYSGPLGEFFGRQP